eukprot:gene20322-20915_t
MATLPVHQCIFRSQEIPGMRRLHPSTFIPVLALLAPLLMLAALAGCASSKQSFYHQESFSDTDTYSRTFTAGDAAACEAARRALLGQGYIINKAQATFVDGTKSFQPDSDQHVEIAFHIVCAGNGKTDRSTAVFVSATQDRYTLKKTNNSASLGLSVLGSVSMPFGSSDDSLVRVASETIRAADFYDRFFSAMERYLTPGVDNPDGTSQHQWDGPLTTPEKKASE